MTMVVQSSSATIALLQNVARQAEPDGIHSVLGLAGAVPVLLGDNIGTLHLRFIGGTQVRGSADHARDLILQEIDHLSG